MFGAGTLCSLLLLFWLKLKRKKSLSSGPWEPARATDLLGMVVCTCHPSPGRLRQSLRGGEADFTSRGLPHKTTHQQMNRPTKLKIKTQLSYDHDPVNTGVTGEGGTPIYNSHTHYPLYGTLIADISPQSPNIFLRLLRLHTHTEGTDFLGS